MSSDGNDDDKAIQRIAGCLLYLHVLLIALVAVAITLNLVRH